MAFWNKLHIGLGKTRDALLSPIKKLLSATHRVDEDFLD